MGIFGRSGHDGASKCSEHHLRLFKKNNLARPKIWDIPPVLLGLSGRNSGKIPERPYNSRHLKAPEHFQNSPPPPSMAGDASFFRSGSGEGLSEPVMEFPAVLGVCLKITSKNKHNLTRFFLALVLKGNFGGG